MNKVAIIINSCEKFYKKTIPRIIDSSKKAKIPSQNIYVVVGDSDKETNIVTENDYNIVFCKYVNIDYNGVIYFTQTSEGLNEIQKYTHFFYIHDTAEFMDHFWEKIINYSKSCEKYIKLEEVCSKNIGLINTTWFIENKKELFSYYINYDKSLLWDYKNGSFPNRALIYEKFNNLARELNEDNLFIFDNTSPIGDVFENKEKSMGIQKTYDNLERQATEYPEPGIIKYQANYGQGGDWIIDL
tara:strand:+ start:362 stop:1090 length:729 start_codon:yes stop_codon:yes gene_type:complete